RRAHMVRQASQQPPRTSARWLDGNTHRTAIAVTLAAACALALGACGDDGDDTEASGARDDEPTETTVAGAAGDGAEDGTGDAAAGLCENLRSEGRRVGK